MNGGLEGVIAAETVLSHADGESGAVWVRGHTVESLAAEHGYEGAVAVMWEGFGGRARRCVRAERRMACLRGAAAARRRLAHRACGVAGRCRANGYSRDLAG